MATEFEIGEVEDYRTQKDKNFSHQQLIMKAFERVIELGTHELHPGFYGMEKDKKTNSTKIVYKEDTQKAFVEAIKTLKAIMICDFDEDGDDYIIGILTELKEVEDNLLEKQIEQFNSLPRVKQNILVKEIGMGIDLNLKEKLNFYWVYRKKELDAYRLILEELTIITKRNNFYEQDMIEG